MKLQQVNNGTLEGEESEVPRWPLKLLRMILKKEYVEEIEGDMEEIYYENVERTSLRKAKWLYTMEALKLVRPSLVRNLKFIEHIKPFNMFNNYFKISIRGLMKSPLHSFINIFGLAAAIGFFIFGYAFTRWVYARDQFHAHKNEVFVATYFANREGSVRQYGRIPRPLGELLKQDFPQIKNVCRVEDRGAVVKMNENVFNERIRFVDKDFLEMLTFPLKWGVSSTLADVNSIILSETMSKKYFGDDNPIGHSLLVKFDKDHSKEFRVTGVAKEFPVARSLDFSFLINIDNLRTSENNYDFHDWSAFMNGLMIQVKEPNDITTIASGMEKYKQLQNKAVTEDWAINSFAFEPLAAIHLKTDDIRDDIFRDGSKTNVTTIYFLVGICALMLLLACFNYINIAITTAAKRLKELGVRKTIGATRRILIVQFLTENIVVTFFAMLVGTLFGWLVVVPWFEGLWHFSMGFKVTDPILWTYLPAVLLITGIASGLYPSLYISKFQTVNILKGSMKFGQRNPVTKIFLGIQLVLACLFVTSAVMFTQNTDYMNQRSWGYSNRDVLYAATADELSYGQLRDEMVRTPGILSISGSANHVGKNSVTKVLHFPSKEMEAEVLAVDAQYFKTLGISIKDGRAFHDGEGADIHSIVINETMANNLDWSNAIGKQLKIDSTLYEVIGVVNDFHMNSFFSPKEPIIFKTVDKKDIRFLTMKVEANSEQAVFETLKKTWVKLFPEVPFTGGYQEDVWGNYYVQIGIHGHVWRVFASVAVIMAVLGLYGLVSLNVAGRVREFSIRKVLGANLESIGGSIFKQYYWLFGAALVVGIPLSYYSIRAILTMSYPYHMPITLWGVVIASSLLVIVLFATISTQVIKVFKSNPVDGLKVE